MQHAAVAKPNAEPDPANVTAQGKHGIHGKSKHTQHGPYTAQAGHTEEIVKPVEESRECSKQLIFTDVADISDVPVTLSTQGGSSDISVAYNVFCVDINPHDRHMSNYHASIELFFLIIIIILLCINLYLCNNCSLCTYLLLIQCPR